MFEKALSINLSLYTALNCKGVEWQNERIKQQKREKTIGKTIDNNKLIYYVFIKYLLWIC